MKIYLVYEEDDYMGADPVRKVFVYKIDAEKWAKEQGPGYWVEEWEAE